MAAPATPPLLLGFILEQPLVRPPPGQPVPGSPPGFPQVALWGTLGHPGSDPQDGMGEKFTKTK